MENGLAMDPDQVRDILAQAVQAVGDAKVPEDLRSVAFEKATELLAGRGAIAANNAAAVAGSVGTPTSVAIGVTGSGIDRLAARLRLSRDVIEAVYTEHGDEIEVTVPPDRLAKSKSAGAREVALLVSAARQASADEPTTMEQIRRVVEEYNKYNQPNFASAVTQMKGVFLVSGPSRARTFRLTRPGWAEATKLVAKLAGGQE